MKERLIALVGKSVDIILIQNTFLNETNYFRACMFGKLYHDSSNNPKCFKVVPNEGDSPHSIEFTLDMVTSLIEGTHHSSIKIKIN